MMKDDLVLSTVPEYIDLKYENENLYINCFWKNINHKFIFRHVKSFRVTQEGLTLKMQSELKNYGQGFILINGSELELYDWLNEQNYGYLDDLVLYKYLLVSSFETLEVVSGFKMEYINENF